MEERVNFPGTSPAFVTNFSLLSLQGDLNIDGDRVLVAKGGSGGSFYSRFEPSKGQVRHIRLDLKLIADVGLVGWEPVVTVMMVLNISVNALWL